MKFLDNLNKIFDNKYSNLRVVNVSIEDSLSLSIQFLIDKSEYENFTKADCLKIYRYAKSIFDPDVNINISFIISNPSEKRIQERARFFLIHDQYIFKDLKLSDIHVTLINENEYEISIPLETTIYKHVILNNLMDSLKSYLAMYFLEKIYIKLIEIPDKEITLSDFQNKKISTYVAPDQFTVTIRDYLVGKQIPSDPYFISVFLKKEQEIKNVALAGEVLNIKKLHMKKNNNLFYKITLSDRKNEIELIYFTNSPEEGKLAELIEGDIICVFGDIVKDNYNKGNILKVKSIAFCDIKDFDYFETSEKPITNIVDPEYRFVQPEPYKDTGVLSKDLNDLIDENLNNKFFTENDFVIFDIESTGLDIQKCKIVELSAVKISNGKISETFTTLVNPAMEIPENATKIHHITNEMVRIQPRIEEVMHDFYKFCQNCILVGHNALNYDIPVLIREGKLDGYLFNHRVIDTLVLSRKYLSLRDNKLNTICKNLGINLENAHRALDDALATAKVFQYMGNHYNIDIK